MRVSNSPTTASQSEYGAEGVFLAPSETASTNLIQPPFFSTVRGPIPSLSKRNASSRRAAAFGANSEFASDKILARTTLTHGALLHRLFKNEPSWSENEHARG